MLRQKKSEDKMAQGRAEKIERENKIKQNKKKGS